MGPQTAKEPASAQRHPFPGSVRFAPVAARWRRAPKTHSFLITLFTSFSGAINREKRSRDFINQGKKCITVAPEKRQFGYEFLWWWVQIVRFLAKNQHKIRQSTIYYAGLLGGWYKWIVDQESDAPSIIFFILFIDLGHSKLFIFIFVFS